MKSDFIVWVHQGYGDWTKWEEETLSLARQRIATLVREMFYERADIILTKRLKH